MKKFFFFILILFTYTSCSVSNNNNNNSPNRIKSKEIKLKNKSFYFYTHVWGIAGNHEEITLSDKKDYPDDKENNYIFYTSDIFFSSNMKDTIIIYAPKESFKEPIKKIFNDSKIIIIGLKNLDEFNDYNINYKKYGLEKISVYN